MTVFEDVKRMASRYRLPLLSITPMVFRGAGWQRCPIVNKKGEPLDYPTDAQSYGFRFRTAPVCGRLCVNSLTETTSLANYRLIFESCNCSRKWSSVPSRDP